MQRAPDPWHWLLLGLSKVLQALLSYDQDSRTIRAHFHDGPARPIKAEEIR